jgi:hypothetical protein
MLVDTLLVGCSGSASVDVEVLVCFVSPADVEGEEMPILGAAYNVIALPSTAPATEAASQEKKRPLFGGRTACGSYGIIFISIVPLSFLYLFYSMLYLFYSVATGNGHFLSRWRCALFVSLHDSSFSLVEKQCKQKK